MTTRKVMTNPEPGQTPHVQIEHFGPGPILVEITCHGWPAGNGMVSAEYNDRRSMRFHLVPPGTRPTALDDGGGWQDAEAMETEDPEALS